AERDGLWGEIYAGHVCGSKISSDITRTAAPAGAYLENLSSIQIRRLRHPLIELNAKAIRIISVLETQIREHAVDGSEAVVHESPPFILNLARQFGIPPAPKHSPQRRRDVAQRDKQLRQHG